VVVQVMAVVAGAAWWHDTKPNAAINRAKTGRRLTAPLSSTSRIPMQYSSVAKSLQKNANYISSRLSENLLHFCRSRRKTRQAIFMGQLRFLYFLKTVYTASQSLRP
jgi:hypothetical protein